MESKLNKNRPDAETPERQTCSEDTRPEQAYCIIRSAINQLPRYFCAYF
nr:MAG TPA: hypothetical protein [Caudoviricetes sp.]